ncbi:MAG: hypothetical protein LBI92_03975 [Azoarcus sp.]|nr:hypothetical protein [Azoarcus sp.]
MSAWTFHYHVNLDERGCYYADVRDPDGLTVFEIKADNSLREGETSIFEDGFMRHGKDMDGLTDYLRQLGVIPSQGVVVYAG